MIDGDGGYTHAELNAAFKLVQPKDNWKYPIDAIADAAKSDVIAVAVTFFTGSVAHMTPIAGGKVRVRAAGYYAAIGA